MPRRPGYGGAARHRPQGAAGPGAGAARGRGARPRRRGAVCRDGRGARRIALTPAAASPRRPARPVAGAERRAWAGVLRGRRRPRSAATACERSGGSASALSGGPVFRLDAPASGWWHKTACKRPLCRASVEDGLRGQARRPRGAATSDETDGGDRQLQQVPGAGGRRAPRVGAAGAASARSTSTSTAVLLEPPLASGTACCPMAGAALRLGPRVRLRLPALRRGRGPATGEPRRALGTGREVCSSRQGAHTGSAHDEFHAGFTASPRPCPADASALRGYCHQA